MLLELQSGLDADKRRFLLSLAANQPDWPLLGIEHLDQLPGIRWKLHNLRQLQKANARKFADQADMLARLPTGRNSYAHRCGQAATATRS